jgi:N-acetylglucosamine malate deacetylase 1
MNIVCIGAHPDDCELFAGGTCIKWAQAGHHVLMVSLTNGDIGHHAMSGGLLAQRRAAEARLSAERGGCAELILDNHDGELFPTLDLRKQIVRIIRQNRADVVLSHRPNDYHPDHRYAAIAVQDAAYMVMVPNFCPDTPRLERNPLFLFMMDHFQHPYPHQADIAVAIDDVVDTKFDMLDAIDSQVYEWLPWIEGKLDEVPEDREARKKWLRRHWDPFFKEPAKRGKTALEKWYGKSEARKIHYAELFEICEYGHQPAKDELLRLLPFLPEVAGKS